MKNIQLFLLTLSLLSVMTACQPAQKEFQPENDSLFKITFSYPASWNWEEDIPYDEPPLFEELPPQNELFYRMERFPYRFISHPTPRQKCRSGWMDIWEL